MTTNKPGSVNQQPLYGCTSCYKYCTWPAGDLRVYDNKCWCDLCWDVRLDDFPGQPQWADLKPYTPVEQQTAPDVKALVEALQAISRNELDAQRAQHIAAEALATHQKGGGQ